ncbi:MAG TPA: UvrD-helicase domain-containing protein, partial [Bacteroidota bacterium]|nr:UvrD-helicase domain-containing protein [Bacteroidota bacterium]
MVLTKDSQLTLPNFTLVSASAGSGKTTALTLRFLKLLLSETIPHNNLRNILAITFTNNAALEMKQRILEYLKKASFGDDETLQQIGEVINLDRDRLVQCAASMVDHILDNYSDLQVQTIDSFLVRVLKISALEMGLPPQFDVVLDRKMFLDESFDLLARQLVGDVEKRNILTRLVDTIHQSRSSDAKFIWNPYVKLADEVLRIYNLLTVYTDEPILEETAQQIDNLRKNVLQSICNIGNLAEASGFEVSKNYATIIKSARSGFFDDVIGKSLTQPVINRPKSKSDLPRYEKIISELETRQKIVTHDVAQYAELVSRTRLQPYIKAYRLLKDNIELMKRQHAQVYLGDANKQLARSIREFNIPEIYFGLGEMIHHFLIDEFQDTSPIQWEVLYPLIGEALSKSGSLFIVGDTKQAIFSFRGGDWQIMANMMKHDMFPSVPTTRIPL